MLREIHYRLPVAIVERYRARIFLSYAVSIASQGIQDTYAATVLPTVYISTASYTNIFSGMFKYAQNVVKNLNNIMLFTIIGERGAL